MTNNHRRSPANTHDAKAAADGDKAFEAVGKQIQQSLHEVWAVVNPGMSEWVTLTLHDVAGKGVDIVFTKDSDGAAVVGYRGKKG